MSNRQSRLRWVAMCGTASKEEKTSQIFFRGTNISQNMFQKPTWRIAENMPSLSNFPATFVQSAVRDTMAKIVDAKQKSKKKAHQ